VRADVDGRGRRVLVGEHQREQKRRIRVDAHGQERLSRSSRIISAPLMGSLGWARRRLK
jgi:hypothetical protein